MIDLASYTSFFFDCDGVILNSNRIKTEAFYQAALVYGHEPAMALMNYHVANGGISRYEKFNYFLGQLLPPGVVGDQSKAIESLLERYARQLEQALMSCEVAEGLEALRTVTPGARWYVVSGGDQRELRALFKARQLAHYFDGGIFGSPANKDEILAGLDTSKPGLFLGDSQYDLEAARRAGLAFCFVSGWSESGYDFSDADGHISQLKELLPS